MFCGCLSCPVGRNIIFEGYWRSVNVRNLISEMLDTELKQIII
jgi:hypothetical protein